MTNAENLFIYGIIIFFMIPITIAGWELLIRHCLFLRDQKRSVNNEFKEWLDNDPL